MTSQYVQDEGNLQNLVKCNVQPAEGKEIILHIYYKNKKLLQLLIKHNPHRRTEESHVVYKYICPREECQLSQTYIGYTTNPLKKLFTVHARNGSIIDHHTQTHGQRVGCNHGPLSLFWCPWIKNCWSFIYTTGKPSNKQSKRGRNPHPQYLLNRLFLIKKNLFRFYPLDAIVLNIFLLFGIILTQ